METKTINNDIDIAWNKANVLLEQLNAGKKLSEILSVGEVIKAMENPLDTIDCSDERVQAGKKIGIAGSGILLPDAEKVQFIETYRGKIKTVTAHEGCGAAALKFQGMTALPEGVTNADELGAYYAKQLALDLGAEYRYITELTNHFHDGKAIVVDATGKLDSAELTDLPPHFVCTGFGLGFSPEYMEMEISLLAGIAIGHHGFGERFTKDQPFYLLLFADDYTQAENARVVLDKIATKFDGKIKVDVMVLDENRN
jgi:hypothetical protein